MSNETIQFGALEVTPLSSGALWCQRLELLCVSDLHLGKSERMARRGGALLPPYDTDATLDLLHAHVTNLQPKTVICLGDSFDDDMAARALSKEHTDKISDMMHGRRWIWIAGNHDLQPLHLDGEHAHVIDFEGVAWRHIATETTSGPEISGHYHPKASIILRGRRMTSACFVMDATRLIMPAFGIYTGGLNVSAQVLRALLDDTATVRLTRAPHHAIPLRLCA